MQELEEQRGNLGAALPVGTTEVSAPGQSWQRPQHLLGGEMPHRGAGTL